MLAALAPLGLAPLLGVFGLWSAAILFTSEDRGWKIARVPGAIFAILIVFAAVSTLWAVDPLASLGDLPGVAILIVCGGLVAAIGVRVDAIVQRRIAVALATGLVLSLVPPLIDRLMGGVFSPAGLSIHNRGLSVMAMLVWPTSLLLFRRYPGRLAGLWIAVLAVAFALVGQSVQLALTFGLVAATLGWFAPRRTPVLLAIVAVAYIAAAPVLHASITPPKPAAGRADSVPRVLSWLPESGYHRLLIWRFTAARIADRPFFGWGFDGARRLPGGQKTVFETAQALPLHPHNAVLQIWVELGAVGAALAAVLAVWAARWLAGTDDRARAAAGAGCFTATFVLLCSTFGIWQNWWLAALFISANLFGAAWLRDA